MNGGQVQEPGRFENQLISFFKQAKSERKKTVFKTKVDDQRNALACDTEKPGGGDNFLLLSYISIFPYFGRLEPFCLLTLSYILYLKST